MKQFVALYVLVSMFMLTACGESDSLKSNKEDIEVRTEQTAHKASGAKQYTSINAYLKTTVAQQFSFVSFEKEVENKELIVTVTFSVDNILSSKIASTEQPFYWSVQLPPSIFEKVSDVPKPVMFTSVPEKELTDRDRKTSRYANFYQVQQRFEIAEERIAEVNRLIQTKDSGYAFKLHDEHYEEAFVFVDLESFIGLN